MASVGDVIGRALAFFKTDEHGIHLSGHAQNLPDYFRWGQKSHSDRAFAVAPAYLGSIGDDLWNIATAAERLDWMRQEAETNAHLRSRWSYYAALDIQTIQVELRSILDYAARVVGLLSGKPGQVPDSFRKLLEWVDSQPSRMDPDLRGLLLAQRDWFAEVRLVRDSLIHFGGRMIVFGEPEEGILFQVYGRGFSGMVSGSALMWNSNVAHFDRYAGLATARILCFLEDLAELAKETLAAVDTEPGFGVRSYHSGFGVLVAWMTNLATVIQSQSPDGTGSG